MNSEMEEKIRTTMNGDTDRVGAVVPSADAEEAEVERVADRQTRRKRNTVFSRRRRL